MRIAHAEGGRTQPQIHQRHLEHTLHRRPAIGLVQMKVKRLDGARIAQRGRDLRGLGRKAGGQAVADALHFQKVAAIVGIKREAAARVRRRSDPANRASR